MSQIIYVKTIDEFKAHVLNSAKPVILDFYADWCPPCRKLGEVFHEVIKTGNGWNIVKINCDIDELAEVSQQHNVSGIPAVFLYNAGKILDCKFSLFNFSRICRIQSSEAKRICRESSKLKQMNMK